MAADYQSKEELMKALSPLNAEGRAAILANPENRVLALNYGANVTMYERDPLGGVKDTFVYLVERKGKHEEKDGYGALGGLAERMKMGFFDFKGLIDSAPKLVGDILVSIADDRKNKTIIDAIKSIDFDKIHENLQGNHSIEFVTAELRAALANNKTAYIREQLPEALAFIMKRRIYLPLEEMLGKEGKELLLGGKDNITYSGEKKELHISDNPDMGALYTVQREMLEELRGIGLDHIVLDKRLIRTVFTQKDDGYITNSSGKGWDGDMAVANRIYAVNAYCKAYELSDEEASAIKNAKQTLADPSKEKIEVSKLERMPLLEALERFGQKTADGKSDLAHNYKYPHEYTAAWGIAAKILGGDDRALVALAETVQKNIYAKGGAYKIDTNLLTVLQCGDGTYRAGTYEIEGRTIKAMQAAIDKVLPSNAIDKDGLAEQLAASAIRSVR